MILEIKGRYLPEATEMISRGYRVTRSINGVQIEDLTIGRSCRYPQIAAIYVDDLDAFIELLLTFKESEGERI